MEDKDLRLIALEYLFAKEGTLPSFLFEIYKKLLKEEKNDECMDCKQKKS